MPSCNRCRVWSSYVHDSDTDTYLCNECTMNIVSSQLKCVFCDSNSSDGVCNNCVRSYNLCPRCKKVLINGVCHCNKHLSNSLIDFDPPSHGNSCVSTSPVGPSCLGFCGTCFLACFTNNTNLCITSVSELELVVDQVALIKYQGDGIFAVFPARGIDYLDTRYTYLTSFIRSSLSVYKKTSSFHNCKVLTEKGNIICKIH